MLWVKRRRTFDVFLVGKWLWLRVVVLLTAPNDIQLPEFRQTTGMKFYRFLTQYAILPHNMESGDRIVTIDYCDVTSPYRQLPGPDNAVGLLCVFTRQLLSNEMTFDLYIWHSGSYWPDLGQVRRCRLNVTEEKCSCLTESQWKRVKLGKPDSATRRN